MANAATDSVVPAHVRRDADLPALRLDASGRRRIDTAAILALALPLFLNSSIQAVLNLTDTWFIGRLSTTAVAAMASIYWLVLGLLMLLGGVSTGVQALAAQAIGAGRFRRAGQVVWSGIWAGLATLPIFLLLAWGGPRLFALAGFDPELTRMASDYWGPRIGGGFVTVLFWVPMSFFYATGRIRLAVFINLGVAVLNALLNEWLMFCWGLGMAGSAWATVLSLACGFIAAMAVLIRTDEFRQRFSVHLTWRPSLRSVVRTLVFGLPIGAAIAFDLLGLAVFQLMITRDGVVGASATQIVMMLTSVAFMPAIGVGMAGTTLVGRSVGQRAPDWARRLGNRVILIAVLHMRSVGVLLGLFGPWLVPLFVPANDPEAAAVTTLAIKLLWIAACYQLFDGLQLGSNFCLRGAGDTRYPAVALFVASWLIFLPLAHLLTFAAGQGPIPGMPGLGLGAEGGWWAAVAYAFTLAVALFGRWLSGRWMAKRLVV